MLGRSSQTPKTADRKNNREERRDAERHQRPNKEEPSIGVDHPAADKSHASHVRHRHERPQQRAEQHNDVPGSAFGEHQGSVQPDAHD